MILKDVFDQRLFNAMVENQPFYREGIVNFPHDWNYYVELCDELKIPLVNKTKNCIELRKCASHNPALEDFAKNFLKDLKTQFKKHDISLICFSSFGPNTQNYPVHRDVMDVFLVQRLGNIEVSFFKTEDDIKSPVNIKPKIAEEKDYELVKVLMKPGDMVYIPRGVYHYINPLESRMTYSFGVEGKVSVIRALKDKSKFDE